MEGKSVKVTAFYKFVRIPDQSISDVGAKIENLAAELGISGLVILATEGVNGTVAGSPLELEKFKEQIPKLVYCESITFKDSWTFKDPFRRFKIKMRDEIVSLGKPDIFPGQLKNHHLSPTEWNRVLSDENVILIDTRNWYETALGVFEGAIDPDINEFNEFPAYLDKAQFPKDKKVLMYCTGGIRCEKALIEMQQRGYQNVYQLEGGILKYLEEFPEGKFKGECFVFDHRVAVDNQLEPSKNFHLCAHCGDPGSVKLACGYCGNESKICAQCSKIASRLSCSKNCAYHLSGDYRSRTS
jgi:UPF0176 protein